VMTDSAATATIASTEYESIRSIGTMIDLLLK
jgi:hypothetical protein